jgi:prefoldin subunit 5
MMTSREAILMNQVARLRAELAQATARIETLETEAAELRAALEHTDCERCGQTLSKVASIG